MKGKDLLKRLLVDKPVMKLAKLRGWLFERMLERRGYVKLAGARLFSMRNYSRTTDKRIRTFATKEPDTLRWIDGFMPGSTLLDVGANVGVYTLYAACRGYRVMAVEPDALNFALLNLNIKDNAFNDRVTAYPFSMHDSPVIAELNMSAYTWGGAHKSFARNLDWQGEELDSGYRQGSAGMSVDELLRQTGVVVDHLKIDVDGNELLVLQGAAHTLADSRLKSVLIELCSGHREYETCLKILHAGGLVLSRRVSTGRERVGTEIIMENHIFNRV